MNRQRSMLSAFAALTALVFGASPALAVDATCTGSCSVPVSADVASNLALGVTVVQLVPATPPATGTVLGPTVTTMDFGPLASNGTFTPPGGTPQPRSLNSTKAFQVFFGANSQQRPFILKQTALPLQSGPNSIPGGAFIVTPLAGVGGDSTKPLPANVTKGARASAVGTGVVLFSATAGPTNTMAATYGITDDPAAGATAPIPLDQPAGHYITTITYTLTVT